MKLALAGPVPPIRSGIADFVGEQLGPLSERFELTLLVDGIRPDDAVRRSGVAAILDVGSRAGRAAAEGADVVLVHLGNDPMHAGAYELLIDLHRGGRPAVVEMHDLVLGHFAAALWFETGKHERYLEEARLGHGAAGERIARDEVIGKRLGLWDLDPWRLPMTGRALRSAAGAVVHSRFARRKGWAIRPELPTAVIPLASLPPEGFPARGEARRRLGLPDEKLVVTSTGFVVPSKRLDAVLDALASLPPSVDWAFRVAGEPVAAEPVRRQAEELGVASRVVFTGYLPWPALLDEMAATDLLANLREPTLGESSGSVAHILSAGVPVAVTAHGWYDEIPDDCVFKVPAGGAAVPALAELLARLAVEPDAGRRVGRGAAAFAAREWRGDRVADLYAAELPRLVAGPSPADLLLGRVAVATASLGVAPLDPRLSARIAAALDPMMPGGAGR